jgi:hypothetical protein
VKTYYGVEVYLHAFLTSVLGGGEWPASRPGRFICRGKISSKALERGLGGPQSRSGRGGEEKKLHHCPCLESNLGRSPRSLVSILTDVPTLLHII